MREFKTRREAEEALADAERREDKAQQSADLCAELGLPMGAERHAMNVSMFQKEAARIRALLPTMPEDET